MPRRYRPEKRVADPDPKYNDRQVQSFINRVMKSGKKSTATRIVYDALDLIEERAGKPGLEVFKAALKEVSPIMEVRPRRVGGATYQVPMEVDAHRQFALAVRWILAATHNRGGKSFSEKLASELMDAANGQGSAVRKREEAHRMAEANRAFSHYRV
ncbi:MAG: 30S ribosomal protein S7 [Gammaproteobacteria bacterium]|nr:30S ribosomal protein S7 [Gammaproteobacteria bacterium]